MKQCALWLGDCLQFMQFIRPHSVDMVLCDLPYGTTRNEWDSVLPLEQLWREYRRVCKPNAAIVLTAQSPFDKVLGSSNLAMLKHEWVWVKALGTGHLNSKLAPLKTHELILVFYSSPPTYNPQGLIRLAKPILRKGRDNGTNYGKSEKPSIREFSNYPRTVLSIPHDSSHFHPTQKPVALMAYLIRTYTNPGMLVLDNCMGSGSTGVACGETGRRFIGIEQDPKFFRIAQQRINAAYAPKLIRTT